jgi:hypothetical protein
MSGRRWFSLLAVVLAAARAAAAPLPGVVGTGVARGGGLLAAGDADPHWELAASADPAAPGPAALAVGAGFPIPPWLANGPGSRWIAPRADQSAGGPPGAYTYRLRFDLSARDATTAVITGRWTSDNGTAEVRLNGQPTGLTGGGDFTGWSPQFTLAAGFLDGTNTLEFVVVNAGDGVNPTGFRAELAGEAEPLPGPGVPPALRTEPADAAAAPGEAVRFTAAAAGSRPLRWQWRFNSAPLAGATGPAFPIAAVNPAWVGGYDVVVRNDWGAVTSRVARLRLRNVSRAALEHEPPGPSSRRTPLAITEILYRPAARDDGRNPEFLELHNANPFPEDVGGWRLRGDWNFTLPDGLEVPGHGRLVIAARPADVAAVHGLTNVLGGFAGELPDEAGNLRLEKRSGAVVLEVAYEDFAPWPAAAAGAGASLVLARPSLGERDPRAWAASAAVGGSPGRPEPIPDGPHENLVLTEALLRPAAGGAAFVELQNAGRLAVEAGGCVLHAGPGGPAFPLPPGTVIPPGGRFVLRAPELAQAAGWPLLWLATPDGARVLDAVRACEPEPGVAYGRDPQDGGWRARVRPTPGEAEAPPAPAPVVFNEIHYHPPAGADDDEFLELFNPGAAAVDLSGWRFTDGVTFTFPPGAALPAGAHAVVVPDAARFLARHPGLDPADGDFDDWFELFNAGDAPVDLTGFSLTDDPARPRRAVIPGGFVLPPRGFLLVWADGEPEQTRPGALHVDFRLARGGSHLALHDPAGREVDRVAFGPQLTDVSEGRWGDGAAGAFWPLAAPRNRRPRGHRRVARRHRRAPPDVERPARPAVCGGGARRVWGRRVGGARRAAPGGRRGDGV